MPPPPISLVLEQMKRQFLDPNHVHFVKKRCLIDRNNDAFDRLAHEARDYTEEEHGVRCVAWKERDAAGRLMCRLCKYLDL
jgi:hypothetical protein